MSTQPISEALFPEMLPSPTPSNSIMDRAFNVVVTLGSIGNSKKVAKGMIRERVDGDLLPSDLTAPVEIRASKDRVSVSKKLLESPELQAIKKLDGELHAYLYATALPSLFKGGVYLVPIVLAEEIEQKLRDFSLRRKQLVEDFLAAVEQRKTEAATQLRELFNPTDYPSIETLRTRFTMEWQYVTFSTPGKLREISEAFFHAEAQKAEQKLAAASYEIQTALRVAMADLVGHLAERLSPTEDGKPRRFKAASVENVQRFLETFAARNVVQDSDLERLVASAKSLVAGVDPDALRENDGLRQKVQEGFAEIKATLDGMIGTVASRRIDLDDAA